MTPDLETLASLEAQLARAVAAYHGQAMSDDWAFSNGSIEPYERRVRELRARIAAMKAAIDGG